MIQISEDLYNRVLEHIAEIEVASDFENGDCRYTEERLKSGDLSEIYYEFKAANEKT